jgi:hypothetical protein
MSRPRENQDPLPSCNDGVAKKASLRLVIALLGLVS